MVRYAPWGKPRCDSTDYGKMSDDVQGHIKRRRRTAVVVACRMAGMFIERRRGSGLGMFVCRRRMMALLGMRTLARRTEWSVQLGSELPLPGVPDGLCVYLCLLGRVGLGLNRVLTCGPRPVW
jgi:hypothetical protein